MGDPTDPPVQWIQATSGDADPEVRVDRRRPGRVEHTNPHLVAMLRRAPPSDTVIPTRLKGGADAPPAEAPGLPEQQEEDADDLAPARGIALGLLFVAPFWAGVAGLCWRWLHR